jgi:hypothetical protein
VSSRINYTKTTPEASKRDFRRCAVLIEPPERVSSGAWAETVGDLLDAAPIDCHSGSWWYAKDGRFGLRWAPCGKMVCTYCAVDWLAQRVAPAWASWRGDGKRTRAFVLDHSADEAERTAEKKALREAGLVWRGEDATVGALSVPISTDGRRRVFWPRTSPVIVEDLGDVDARLLHDGSADRALVEALRAIPVPEPVDLEREPREPSEYHGSLPPGMALRGAIQIAERRGASFITRTAKNANGKGWSIGLKRDVVEAFWRRR